ncbi:hypothetical protein AYO21_01821 [Fonsecaea monophora]|uniref:Uncharacterized protein n=2 Tax=Fonsecaea TaxID=40354 RepID=A0A0D2GJU3_9EURO|nr:uncharacterized protein Z517_04071 [Fonsecaea pedrosoi CBS 271.37]XP_022515921.1 hypothetical protein AYO21_01821 [Fonsecaea monophora]KAH0831623.1 hypothetical protein FOPE_02932 [Fonsecaea pedrosoi]KIW81048.1 hypothetical protein Z517_04071 [Fonsecaea pedrosoi CBS 271.37]OAG43969.1 hypothetical protein AYO21_01821 [Fonsecaea monophora]
MTNPIDNPCEDEPQALPFRTGGSLARIEEYTIFYFLAICSWCLEIVAACLGSLYGGESHPFIGTVTPFLALHWMAFLQTCWMMATAPRNTIADRMAYLNLACRFQRLCAPTAVIGMVTWAVAYRFRGKASSSAYWIIFLVVWISETVVCIMNVYNNISWESDLLYQLAPDEPQGNFWLAVLGLRSMCRVKHKHRENTEMELKETASKRV